MSIRLYIEAPLAQGAVIELSDNQAHYARNVMRLAENSEIFAFNGEDGQWLALMKTIGKKSATIEIISKICKPRPCPEIALAFSMIKNKSELVVEKATELGISTIHAMVTQHSVVRNINLEKLRAHAIEATEQCERFSVPIITAHKSLADFLGVFPKENILLYADESGNGRPLRDVLSKYAADKAADKNTINENALNKNDMNKNSKIHNGICILVGPEGGFSSEEHRILQSLPFALGFGIGPRILRADTAAVAAIACVMSIFGDWNEAPRFVSEKL